MTRPLARHLVPALSVLLGCNWTPCADETVDFTLAAPGDAVEIVVRACGPRRGADLELSITLETDHEPMEPLAVAIDGVSISATPDGWAGGDGFSDLVTDADCDPGRRITVQRVDSDDSVRFTGTLTAEMSARPHHSCSATITVLPLP